MSDERHTWVLGGSGTLGSCVVEALAPQTVVAPSSSAVDITELAALQALAARKPPRLIFNCAGFTAVDLAESQPQRAFLTNATGPGNVARIAKQSGATLVHVSTDYVFDGTATTPYAPNAECAPINAYGRSKLDGDRAVLELAPLQARVVRTSWLFGPAGDDFVGNMTRRLKRGEKLRVVNDQHGRPTYAPDLARALIGIAARKPGVYHYANSGVTTWYELTLGIAETLDIQGDITPVETRDFPTAAARPAYSVLSTDGLGFEPSSWRDALARCLKGENSQNPL